MAVLLVLITFLVFAVLDWFSHRGKAPSVALAVQPPRIAALERIAGFLAPENLRYHAGHAWLQRERQNLVRAGADEFAAAFAGNVSKIELLCPVNGYVRDRKRLRFIGMAR